MRFFSNLLRSGGALNSSISSNTSDCLDRQIRLWLHIDLTNSFAIWRANSPDFLKTSLHDLIAKYPNLKFGMSGFGDRPMLNIPQMEDQCYAPFVELDEPYDDKKQKAMDNLAYSSRSSYNDLEEDPLTAMPWIAKNKFGDYKDDELRLLVVVTDYGPHYAPLYKPGDKTGTDDPTALPEDFVTCDSTKRWGYIDELMDPVKTRRVFPFFAIYALPDPARNSMPKWEAALKLMNYDDSHIANLGWTYDPHQFTSAIEKLISENKCSPAPTNAPSSGTIQTDPAEASTSAAPADTTTIPAETTAISGDTTTIAGETTTISGESTTITTATATTKESHNEIPVIVGASAGIAALLAAGAGYRLLKPGEPTLDIEEEEVVQAGDETADREAAIALGEDAYE